MGTLKGNKMIQCRHELNHVSLLLTSVALTLHTYTY